MSLSLCSAHKNRHLPFFFFPAGNKSRINRTLLFFVHQRVFTTLTWKNFSSCIFEPHTVNIREAILINKNEPGWETAFLPWCITSRELTFYFPNHKILNTETSFAMLTFDFLIASSETSQLSPNLRVIGYSNFYCCTGHNSFLVCFYVMPKLPKCILISLPGRCSGFFLRMCIHLNEWVCFLLWFSTSSISDRAASRYCSCPYSLHLLHRTSQFFFHPVNRIVFCTQTLHRTAKNLMKYPQQPLPEPCSAVRRWQWSDPAWALRLLLPASFWQRRVHQKTAGFFLWKSSLNAAS